MSFTDSGAGRNQMADRAPTLPSDTEGKLRNQVLSLLVKTLQSLLPRITGTFTLAAAATTTVPQPAILASSVVSIAPTNAAAAALMAGAKSAYWDPASNIAGASFAVKTADGSAPAGTETFSYFVINPV